MLELASYIPREVGPKAVSNDVGPQSVEAWNEIFSPTLKLGKNNRGVAASGLDKDLPNNSFFEICQLNNFSEIVFKMWTSNNNKSYVDSTHAQNILFAFLRLFGCSQINSLELFCLLLLAAGDNETFFPRDDELYLWHQQI